MGQQHTESVSGGKIIYLIHKIQFYDMALITTLGANLHEIPTLTDWLTNLKHCVKHQLEIKATRTVLWEM